MTPHSSAQRTGIWDATVTQPHQPRVTQDHWVYLCHDAAGRLLYVGVTSCGLKRFANGHSKTATWWSVVASIEIEHHPSREAALAREQALISDREPIHNVIHADTTTHRIPDGTAPTRWLSLADIADWLSAEPAWIELKVAQGMPHAYIGDNLRFNAQEVRAWLR